ncbi:MAG: PaaI family thioesterase [Parvibaculaceae bacterium]
MNAPTGRLSGYQSWEGNVDPFEDHAGPYFFKKQDDGRVRCAFEAKAHHCNGGGFLHGGALMTFADFALFAIASDVLDGPGVTVSFNSEFISAVGAGNLIEATGEVVRNTRSMVFVRGQVICDDETLLNFSAIIKRIAKKG